MDLCNACEKGDYDEVMKCLNSPTVDVNTLVGKHRVRRTALHHAAEYGYLKVVKVLVWSGADPNIRSSDNRIPLHEACVGGFEEIVKYLVSLTNDINCVDNQGQTPAHVACYHGETQCLTVLLDNNCDVELKDGADRSCLDLAVISDQSQTVGVLLEKYSNLIHRTDSEGQSAIHKAAQYGAVECLKVFTKHHIDLQQQDVKGIMPSHVAAKYGKLTVLKQLLRTGSTLLDIDFSGRSVAHFVGGSGSVECVHWMNEQRIDLSVSDASGNTVVHYAAMNADSAECINCLSKHGANFDITNNDGDTPFYCSRKAGHPVAFQNALSGKIICHLCLKKAAKHAYEETHRPSTVEQNISTQHIKLYGPNNITKSVSHKLQQNSKHEYRRPVQQRNLAGKYYGKEIVYVPEQFQSSAWKNR